MGSARSLPAFPQFSQGRCEMNARCNLLRWNGNRLAATAAMAIALATGGCSKGGSDEAATPQRKEENKTAPGVLMDADTQARIGLKIEAPEPADWRPVIHVSGRVANPLTFMEAAADYEAARTAAGVSRMELERTQKLAAQENASAKTLEGARAAAERDALGAQAAEAKFAADWGLKMAGRTNLTEYAEQLRNGEFSLARLFLPAGRPPERMPTTASVYIFNDETNRVAADCWDTLNTDPATQQPTLLFAVWGKLPADAAVEADLKMEGEPIRGVRVPPAAILRHEGKGWVYVQTEMNRFVRVAVALDRPVAGGWFAAEDLSATNRIVTVGGQTLLSAELGGGSFNTGQRD